MGVEKNYSAEEYLDNYYNYYDKKAAFCKKWYNRLVILDIVISGLIPLATLWIDIFSWAKFIIAIIGSAATIISSLKAALGFHKNWIEYRTTAEILKFHRYLYESNSPPYDGEDRNNILILNVHSIVETENKNWRAISLSSKRTSKNS